MYVVYLNGEWDMDANGNVFVSYLTFDNLNDAEDAAAAHERATGCIAAIDYVG